MCGSEMLAVSKAGHDKGQVFLVLGEAGDRYLIADGKGRTLERPKYKNKKHLQPVLHPDEALLEQMRQIRRDEDVRRILKAYRMISANKTTAEEKEEQKANVEVMHVEE